MKNVIELQEICPECNHEVYKTTNSHLICPNCGAKLKEDAPTKIKKSEVTVNPDTFIVSLKIEGETIKTIGKIEDNNLVCGRNYGQHFFRKFQSINVNSEIMNLDVEKIIVNLTNGDTVSVSMQKIKRLERMYDLEWNNDGELQTMIPLKIFDQKKANGEFILGLDACEFDSTNTIENWDKRKIA